MQITLGRPQITDLSLKVILLVYMCPAGCRLKTTTSSPETFSPIHREYVIKPAP